MVHAIGGWSVMLILVSTLDCYLNFGLSSKSCYKREGENMFGLYSGADACLYLGLSYKSFYKLRRGEDLLIARAKEVS